MMKVFLLPLFVCFSLLAEEPLPPLLSPQIVVAKDELSRTSHKVKLGIEDLSYTAVAGMLPVKDEKVKGSLFYVSYVKEGLESYKDRPVTFCFNGGPGSSSVWLHMGAFGPKKVVLTPNQNGPYHVIDNLYSLLDVTDLVFIDPMSTGFSRTSPDDEAKQFHGLDEDVQSVADFILLWTSRNLRWDSPKYLAGESYGGIRASFLASKLYDDDYLNFNGLIFVSALVNYQTIINPSHGNDLPYILALPSYTSAAWSHKKLPEDLMKDLKASLLESEKFALGDYATSLLKGDDLTEEEKNILTTKLARFTGLTEGYIRKSNFRIPVISYTKELLRDQSKTIGRFDARLTGIEGNQNGCYMETDPSFDTIIGPFTAAVNQYLRKDLLWETDRVYKSLLDVQPWSFGKTRNSFVNGSENLRETLSRNPNMKIFVAAGYSDLAIPYFTNAYTFNHLNLSPSLKSNIEMKFYVGGHMMYTEEESLKQLNADIKTFIRSTSTVSKKTK